MLRKFLILILLLIPTALAYNRYLYGNINLDMVNNVINSLPREYFKQLDSLSIYEGICTINGEKKAVDGYYKYEYRIRSIFKLKIYGEISKANIWICNLKEERYIKDYLKGVLLHELGHHHQISVLKQFRNLSEEHAEEFVMKYEYK